MENNTPILEADGLYHIYESKAEDGNVVALRGLQVAIAEGEAVAVVGPSGSGKSTLLKCIGGLMKPTAGMVRIGGENLTRLTGKELVEVRQRMVSFIFQEGNLLPHLSAVDNVAQPLRHQKVAPKEAKARAMDLLDRLGLGERMHARPALLSGGEQQRTAIARALITKPRLILADEPTGALDPITSREVLTLFTRLHEEEKVSFLIVTHNREVADICDRSLELRDGRFVAQHGTQLDVSDLGGSRELIVDDLGTVTFPPDVLIEMGGSGRYSVEDLSAGRLVLTSAEQSESLVQDGSMSLSSTCPACKYEYEDETTQLCPSCGSSRPMVSS